MTSSVMASSVTIAPPGGTKYSQLGAGLDESLYDLGDDEIKFLVQQTGIEDPEELKKHILDVQHEVYQIHPYPCIKLFHFVKTKTCRHSMYSDVLQLAKTRPGALYLDVGCGVGNDTRKLVADGWPANQVIASDLHADFWNVGHKVFKSTPESIPVKFVPGDVFDKSFLESMSIPTETPEDTVDLSSLTTLTPLRGRLSVIHASSFFHLFNEQQQTELAYRLAPLLSPEPGSMIFGGHVGRPQKELLPERLVRPNTSGVRMFCHSPESFAALWEEVFGPGRVETKAAIREVVRKDFQELDGIKNYYMVWAVKRL